MVTLDSAAAQELQRKAQEAQARAGAHAHAINAELRELNASTQAVFWLRPHGALGGRTVEQMLQADELSRVLALARAWADEEKPARGGQVGQG